MTHDPERPLVDLRTYTIVPRGMAGFLEVFADLAMPILIETLGMPIGTYTSVVGPLNQFTHLWAYRDMADYEHRSACRDGHPEWGRYLEASGHFIVAQEIRLIRSADVLVGRS